MADTLERLEAVIAQRLTADPSTSYVASLGAKGQDQILKKVAEEAVETVIASKSMDNGQVVREVADLWFHCMVMLGWHGVKLSEVMEELERREGRSGLDEKASRTKGNP
jgi:phosphoribosyl-ATP pyrophosphohydrolase